MDKYIFLYGEDDEHWVTDASSLENAITMFTSDIDPHGEVTIHRILKAEDVTPSTVNKDRITTDRYLIPAADNKPLPSWWKDSDEPFTGPVKIPLEALEPFFRKRPI